MATRGGWIVQVCLDGPTTPKIVIGLIHQLISARRKQRARELRRCWDLGRLGVRISEKSEELQNSIRIFPLLGWIPCARCESPLVCPDVFFFLFPFFSLPAMAHILTNDVVDVPSRGLRVTRE